MAGWIAPELLHQIRSANDIVEVIGGYLPLKRAGTNFQTLCPFHREKSPSFNVNPQRQIFHCFGCHKGGDVFHFVKEYESLTFPEAVKRLAARANITLEFEKTPGQQQAKAVKDTLLQMHEGITQRWQSALTNEACGQVARDYLERRGVSEEAIKLFRLGYAPEVWDDTVNWAKSKGYELPLVETAGLVIKKEENEHYYDRFRGRLMFPICDEQGRVIAFSGRVLDPDAKAAKYVNSPETPIFTKGRVFYGLDKSKRAILDAGFAVICEGQLDLIACYTGGVQNIVAPQGTAFTPEHARILKRYADEVVLCFDSDPAGQKASIRIFDSLMASGLAIRVAPVPAPHDPDSYIKEQGGAAFQKLIQGAEGFFDFYLNFLCRDNDPASDKGRLAITRSLAEALYKAASPVLTDTYAQKAAQRLGVSVEAIRAEFKKVIRSGAAKTVTVTPPTEEEVEITPVARPNPPEFWLLKLTFLHEELVPWIAEHLNPEWIEHSLARDLISLRIRMEKNTEWQNFVTFLDQVEDPASRNLLTEAATEDRPIPDPEGTLIGTTTKEGLVERLRNDYIKRQLQWINNNLTIGDTTELLTKKKQLHEMRATRLIPPAAKTA